MYYETGKVYFCLWSYSEIFFVRSESVSWKMMVFNFFSLWKIIIQFVICKDIFPFPVYYPSNFFCPEAYYFFQMSLFSNVLWNKTDLEAL